MKCKPATPEIWKAAYNAPGYEVSDLGRVRRIGGRILKLAGGDSYPVVTLCGKQRTVHTLVLETFVSPRPKGCIARHFPDRNPRNCELSNLSWSTFKQNQADRITHGTADIGEYSHKATLTERQVRGMRCLYKKGRVTQQQIAKRYNAKASTVQAILSGRTWKHAL